MWWVACLVVWVQALADVNRLLAPVSQVLAGIRWHHEPALSDGVGAYRSVTLNSSPVFIAERVVVAVKNFNYRPLIQRRRYRPMT